MIEGSREAIEALERGETVFLLHFSMLDPSLPDIFVSLPSLKEFNLLTTVLHSSPESDHVLEDIVCSRHILSPIIKAWLTRDAPAGIIGSICLFLVDVGYPKTVDETNIILNMARSQASFYDVAKSMIASHTGASPQDLARLDAHGLSTLIIGVERQLRDHGLLQQPFSAIDNSAPKKSGSGSIEQDATRMRADLEGRVTRAEYERANLNNRRRGE